MEQQNQQQRLQHKQWQQESKEPNDKAHCKQCGALSSPGSDICEGCKGWLLDGQCSFCYAPFNVGQHFCKQCGNPPEGIVCGQCKKISRFDFCPNCETPLSRTASAYLASVEASDEVTALKILSEELSKLEPPDTTTSNQDAKDQAQLILEQLKAYGATTHPMTERPIPPSKSGFFFESKLKDHSETLHNNENQLKERLKSEEAILQKEQELVRQITLLQEKQFSDNQSARKFYASIKLMLPQLVQEKILKIIGWKCNYTNTIHPGPDDCGQPGLGGIWIHENGGDRYHTQMNEH